MITTTSNPQPTPMPALTPADRPEEPCSEALVVDGEGASDVGEAAKSSRTLLDAEIVVGVAIVFTIAALSVEEINVIVELSVSSRELSNSFSPCSTGQYTGVASVFASFPSLISPVCGCTNHVGPPSVQQV
jgi:hypothetical protein